MLEWSERRTWLLQLLLALVFTSIGVGLAVLAWNEGEWGLWFAVAVFGGVGLFLLASTARVRAEQNKGRTDAQAVMTSMTSPTPGAWTFAQIGEEVRDALLRDWSRGVEVTAGGAAGSPRSPQKAGLRCCWQASERRRSRWCRSPW